MRSKQRLDRDDRSTSAFDVGLQAERTGLAWDRTALAVIATGLLLVRATTTNDQVFLAVFGLCVVTSGGALACLSAQRYEQLQARLRSGSSTAHFRLVVAVSATAMIAAMVGLALAVALVVE